MKYAVISDVHGNHPALQAILEDVRRQDITHCLFLGDYCISGPWPDQCIETIRAIPEKTVIRGNEEKYLENLIGKDPSGCWPGSTFIISWHLQNSMRRISEMTEGPTPWKHGKRLLKYGTSNSLLIFPAGTNRSLNEGRKKGRPPRSKKN